MANADTPFGLRLIGTLYSSDYNARVRPYTVLAADGTALFVNDAVTLTGTSALGEDGIYHPVITQAAEGNTSVGVVVGFFPNVNYQSQIYRTASTLRTVFVCDDPNAVFEIQSDGTAAVGDVGSNADIVVGAGSTTTGLSGMELKESSVTTATAQLRILGWSPRLDNEVGDYGKFLVMFNEHYYKQTTGV